MLVVETLAKIRRACFQDKKLTRQICRERAAAEAGERFREDKWRRGWA